MNQIGMAIRGMKVDPKAVARAVFTEVLTTPGLLECDWRSIMQAVIRSCGQGFVPDRVDGKAYLVPFKDKEKRDGTKTCQLIIGYRGLLAKAWRSHQMAAISVEDVHTNDPFTYRPAKKDKLDHRFDPFDDDRGDYRGGYMIAWVKGSDVPAIATMNLKQINAIRDRSPASRSSFSPWNSNPHDVLMMRRKTILRHGIRMLPSEIEDAINQEEQDADQQAEERADLFSTDALGAMVQDEGDVPDDKNLNKMIDAPRVS